MGDFDDADVLSLDKEQCINLIGSRLLARYYEAADTVFMDGSTPWEVDEAMVEFGFSMGPFETQDLTGVDVSYEIRQSNPSYDSGNRRRIPLITRLLELGKLGKKSGAGWYRYPGGGGKVDDPIVADLAIEESYFEKRERVDYSATEICERLLFAMIQEACDILDAGVAQGTADINLASIQICGFPKSKGGVMQYAGTLGAQTLTTKFAELAKEDAAVWRINPMSQRYIENGFTPSQTKRT